RAVEVAEDALHAHVVLIRLLVAAFPPAAHGQHALLVADVEIRLLRTRDVQADQVGGIRLRQVHPWRPDRRFEVAAVLAAEREEVVEQAVKLTLHPAQLLAGRESNQARHNVYLLLFYVRVGCCLLFGWMESASIAGTPGGNAT